MKSIIKRVLILFAIFLASFIFFMIALNRHEVKNTKNMAEASLPVLFIKENDTLINRMHGYKQEIDEVTLRDNLTLLSAYKTVTIAAKAYDNEIKSAAYQVTSLSDGSIIENGSIKAFTASDGYLTADITLKADYEMKQEYMLRVAVNTGSDEDIYYYTRIVQRTGQNTEWYLSYVQAFYQNCIGKNLTDDMAAQLETESSQSNSSLHYVTLKSGKDQLIWGNLTTTLVKKAVPSILEVNETTVSIGQEYIISASDDEGHEEYYTVEEYYRMRKAQDQVVLLDYERTATQIFDGHLPILDETSLDLGITGKNVNYVTNDSADIAAFVQAGELWQYDRSSNKVTRLFGFRDDDLTDDRIIGEEYNISISSVSGEGNTTFIVYGYRAAGAHEGTTGISIYRYTAESNTTSELMFIPVTDSFELADQGLSRLAYVNAQNQCFLYYDDTLYTIQLDDGTVTALQTGLEWQMVSTSDSQMRVAWNTKEDRDIPRRVCELNLETGETVNIDAPDGDGIKVLGYAGEDMIYGLAHESDCYTDSTGNEVFPMYRICIRDPQGELVKDYSIDGIYVTGIERDDELIVLKRYEKSDDVLRPISDDRFIHYAPQSDSAVDIKLTVDKRKGTEVRLVFASGGESSNLLTMYTRYAAESGQEELQIPELKYKNDNYYVYSGGSLSAIYKNVNQAIITADNEKGVVLDSSQRYVWERGNMQTSAKIDASAIPQGLLNANTDDTSIQDAVGSDHIVWNLSGCSLNAICYQISNGYAVVGKWSDGSSRLILGYDQFNVWIYDPGTGETYAVALEDAEPAFEALGNIFISYH